ncbi:class I SAM-dependent DNA methyltransferase [Muribaculum intestinale]|jgi:type I restriction enzyme M protein|uniref:type I restriction-modification system subunit M n=1 Tax=Muribaculum intestinale TaxID=1796646 RepID=UPI000F4812C8|nr:class I SAM-dependent DNA methyltransferase [Muribaculum intestinale]MCX4294446.1 class I SAM-dependent DNA methyltransferase [Prevotella sp.]ROT17622.1 N-6 DNA methylase [Muribaculaceae bacterium Isolate-110 (HZI)]
MTEQELAGMIWNIKEIIRGVYDDTEVENVILPFTLLRRLDCVLQDKYDELYQQYRDFPDEKKEVMLMALMRRNGLTFFNTSGLSLNKLLAQPKMLADNFKAYLDGFTQNVRNILLAFTQEDGENGDISRIYSRLDRNDLLFQVTESFVNNADLHPDRVDNAMMGTIFEIIIRKSKETTNTKAGQFYTPREVVHLLVSLVMHGREAEVNTLGKHFQIYDPCCGTGGMLTEGKRYLQSMTDRTDMKVYLFGQELNEKTYAICKSDLLIKGDLDKDRNIALGDTLANDQFPGEHFGYMLANPPFGVDWKKIEGKVKEDAAKSDGRFSVGLPSTSDGSLLFLLHMISKMDPNGSRIGIVLNGSPLFNGAAGSGWSEIRKMLMDRDLLDAIIALPKNLFYGTDISTYLWILDNNKPAERKGKVLMVDATHPRYARLLQRSLGKKRYEIPDEAIDEIVGIYGDFTDATLPDREDIKVARLMDVEDFLYTTVTIYRPLRLIYSDIAKKATEVVKGEKVKKADKETLEHFAAITFPEEKINDEEMFAIMREHFGKKLTQGFVKLVRTLGTTDPDAPAVWATPGKPESGFVIDPALTDTETIPMKENIDEYIAREVLPFVPDAWRDPSKDKVGCEFPLTRLFYRYTPLRDSSEILADLMGLEADTTSALQSLISEAR